MVAVLKRSARYSVEDLASVRASGVEALLERHWREIAHYQDIELNVDWSVYEQAEALGKLRIFTARVDDELVGYAVFFVNHNPHYKDSLQAVQDILFLAPEHRKGRIGFGLLAFADMQLAGEGVQATYHHSKAAHNIGPLLERMGYELVDVIYAKRLDR